MPRGRPAPVTITTLPFSSGYMYLSRCGLNLMLAWVWAVSTPNEVLARQPTDTVQRIDEPAGTAVR